jgi:hypothetical protein
MEEASDAIDSFSDEAGNELA